MQALAQVIEFKPGKAKARKKVKNIILRNGIYYFRAMIEGKLWCESLGTGDRETAAARAKVRRDEIKALRWAPQQKKENVVSMANIGMVIKAYIEICAENGNVSEEVVAANVAALRRVLAEGLNLGKDKVDALSAQVLTGDLLKRYGRAKGLSRNAPDSLRRSVASTITQARSVFAKGMIEEYADYTNPDTSARGIGLPDLDGFMKRFVTLSPKKPVSMPDVALYTRTIEAGRAMDGDIGLVFLLAYELGMRAGEIAMARWNWIECEDTEQGPRYWMVITRRESEGFEPKGKNGRIPIFDGVYARLMQFRQGDGYMLSGTVTARVDKVKREFSAWMRGIGWETIKCAHELRRLRGSWWFKRYGVERTFTWLRHANMQTTIDHYATLPTQNEPAWIENPGRQWDELLK